MLKQKDPTHDADNGHRRQKESVEVRGAASVENKGPRTPSFPG